MLTKTITFSFILSIFCFSCFCTVLEDTEKSQIQINQDFDEYVTSAMKDWFVPGMALGIIKDNQIVLAKGYGVRSLDHSDHVDEETVFPICS
jgi:CubicO group peptidase (beta-lactamase class C family)